MNVFERYAPFIQDYIYRSGWQSLRAVQNAAGDAIFNTEENVLLTASTASGKTEAAFFPILTLLDENPSRTVGGFIHCTPQGADQRPVRAPQRALRGGGDRRHPLARGRQPVEEKEAAEKALRHFADHAGISGIAAGQQAHGDPVSVRRSAFYRHR